MMFFAYLNVVLMSFCLRCNRLSFLSYLPFSFVLFGFYRRVDEAHVGLFLTYPNRLPSLFCHIFPFVFVWFLQTSG